MPYPIKKKFNYEGRQEVSWVNKGLIDFIYFMNYNDSPDFEWMKLVQSFLNDKRKLIPLYSNCGHNSDGKLISRKSTWLEKVIEKSLAEWPHGLGIYWYESLNADQVATLRKRMVIPDSPKNLNVILN
jgi:hypothetical protein